MDLKEIAGGLSAKFNLDELVVEDGELALEIDGMPILLGEAEGEAILMTGFVGEAPSEGGEFFANMLLEGTTALMDTKSAALARNPETGAYALVQRLDKGSLSVETFCEELTDFVNRLESWRKMLENFRPAAVAAKAATDAQPNAQEISMSGFMQV